MNWLSFAWGVLVTFAALVGGLFVMMAWVLRNDARIEISRDKEEAGDSDRRT